MSATVIQSTPNDGVRESSWTLYKGWIVGLLIILVVLAVGATLWLHFHP